MTSYWERRREEEEKEKERKKEEENKNKVIEVKIKELEDNLKQGQEDAKENPLQIIANGGMKLELYELKRQLKFKEEKE